MGGCGGRAGVSILCLDPGTLTGWATPLGSGVWDLTPRKARKRPPAPAEPEQIRCGRLFDLVVEESREGGRVVVEGAAGFMRGKAAVKVSNELRGAIKAACHFSKAIYEEVQPQDWKRTLFGRANVLPPEYLARAQSDLHYRGESEDEAAALWLLTWATRYAVGRVA